LLILMNRLLVAFCVREFPVRLAFIATAVYISWMKEGRTPFSTIVFLLDNAPSSSK